MLLWELLWRSYADSRLTGRKIICDTYGGRHGGGAFCVDGDTEYLSPNGWIKTKDYIGGKVAQWDSGKLTFVNPKFYHVSDANNMYHIKNASALDMVLSENHDMVFETSKGNIVKKRVKDVLTLRDGFMNCFTGKVPTYFEYERGSSVDLTDDEIRLQVAFSADGSIQSDYRGRIRVKKEYKKERVRDLLKKMWH